MPLSEKSSFEKVLPATIVHQSASNYWTQRRRHSSTSARVEACKNLMNCMSCFFGSGQKVKTARPASSVVQQYDLCTYIKMLRIIIKPKSGRCGISINVYERIPEKAIACAYRKATWSPLPACTLLAASTKRVTIVAVVLRSYLFGGRRERPQTWSLDTDVKRRLVSPAITRLLRVI